MRTFRIRSTVRPVSSNHVRVSTTVSNGSRTSTRSKLVRIKRK